MSRLYLCCFSLSHLLDDDRDHDESKTEEDLYTEGTEDICYVESIVHAGTCVDGVKDFR